MINLRKSDIVFTSYYKIPVWALSALVNDDDSGLEPDDLEDLDNFLRAEELEGYNLELPADVDEVKYFSFSPAFGLGSEVVDCRFFK